MKRMLIVLLACLFVSPLYAFNNAEDSTIEYPKGVTCHFESQTTLISKIHRDTDEVMDTYVCEGKGRGLLSVVYYSKSEDQEAIGKRILSIWDSLTLADVMHTDSTRMLYVANKARHLIRIFRFESDKRIEYLFFADNFEKTVKSNDFIGDMDKLEVPATPVTAEE